MADAASEAMLIASETLSANAAAAASTCAHAVSETVSAGKVAANAACASSRETSGMSGGSGGSGGAAMKSLQSQACLDQGTKLIQRVVLPVRFWTWLLMKLVNSYPVPLHSGD